MLLTIQLLIAAVGLLHVVAGHGTTGGSRKEVLTTCKRLQASLGTELVQLSGDEYSSGASNAWSLFNTVQRPTCIVFPRQTSHVQRAMEAIYQDNVRYAVQAGGHSAMPGWNNVDQGILLFFSHMKNVSYDAEKDTITLEPGVHWGEAITQLQPLGVAPAGGRFNDVGTGLLLGGGLSYLSGEHGFSADLYVELDVVLVTGQLVTATATNAYADLFRALKGGANRFGIVTRYEVQAIHTGTERDESWYGGLLLFPESAANALLNALEKYVRTVNDPKASLLIAFANTVNGTEVTPSHIVTLYYHGSELPPSIFGDFLAITPTLTALSRLNYLEVNSVLGNGADRGYGQLFGASVLNGTAGIDQFKRAFEVWREYTNEVKSMIYGTTLAFTVVQASQVLAGRARGGNLMDPPVANYAAVQVQTQLNTGLKEIPDAVTRARQVLFQRLPRSPGLPLYINECDAGQNVFPTYGRYPEMKITYMKYDPTRFNLRFTDGPSGL